MSYLEYGMLEVGTVVADRYRLEGIIARGGMGVVYQAEDRSMKREVALKILPRAARSERTRKRFIQECKLTASINHPHVVRIFDAGFHEGAIPFLVMERMIGQTLSERVKARGPLQLRTAVLVMEGVARALVACHAAGVFHRDVKPGNVFLRTRPQRGIVLFDFGLSISTHRATRLTAQGVVVGTPAYMAPEQVVGRDADERTDIYGAGAAGYFALTGQRPVAHGVEDVDTVFDAIVKDAPIPARDIRPSVPYPVSDLVDRALEKLPIRRFQSAQEMAEACADTLAFVAPSEDS